MSNHERYLQFCAINGIQRGALERGFQAEADSIANHRPGNKKAMTKQQWLNTKAKRAKEKAKKAAERKSHGYITA